MNPPSEPLRQVDTRERSSATPTIWSRTPPAPLAQHECQSQDGTVLVVGADGVCGSGVARRLAHEGLRLAETTRRVAGVGRGRVFLDLAAPPDSWVLPDHVVLAYVCAGIPSLEACRRHPEQTARINVHRTYELVCRLANRGAFTVVLSSAAVFDGILPMHRIDDRPCPASEYGRQKAALEHMLGALGDRVSLVRLSKVVPPTHPLFSGWVRAASRNEPIRPFLHITIAPVTSGFAAEAIIRAGLRALPGVVHVSGDRDIGYTDAARHIAVRLGRDPSIVIPQRPPPGMAPRQAGLAYESLDTSRLQHQVGLDAPSSWLAIDACLEDAVRRE